MRTTKTLIRLRRCTCWFESPSDSHVKRYVFTICGIYQPQISEIKTKWSSAHKTYSKTCATSKDSDQPAHPRSLIRVFVDRMCLLQPPHYENMHIQIYWKFHFTSKNWKFSDKKKLWYFSHSCSKYRLWVLFRTASVSASNDYAQSMFFSKIRKIMYTPVNHSFTIWKWGLRGSKLYRRIFVMGLSKERWTCRKVRLLTLRLIYHIWYLK